MQKKWPLKLFGEKTKSRVKAKWGNSLQMWCPMFVFFFVAASAFANANEGLDRARAHLSDPFFVSFQRPGFALGHL